MKHTIRHNAPACCKTTNPDNKKLDTPSNRNRRSLLRPFCLLFIGAALSGCLTTKKSTVKPSFSKIKHEGRIAINKEGVAEVYWPGSGFTIKFKGTGFNAILEDEKGFNYFNVVIDDSLANPIRVRTNKAAYTIAAGLKDTIHTVKLLKRADWFRGKTKVYGFQFAPRTKVYRALPQKRMIEFYGNSVTVGAAVEDATRDRGDSTFTNNYNSYAALTARHFNADLSCIASSGIGLMASAGNLIMPELFDRLNPDDSSSKWPFSTKQPDIVVINLFQNDSWIVHSPEFEQFKRRFGTQPPTEDFIVQAYVNFVRSIRMHYPHTQIICTLGSMDAVRPGSPWPGYITKAATAMNDPKLHTYFFPYKNSPNHPKINDQQKMADDLIHFISENIGW